MTDRISAALKAYAEERARLSKEGHAEYDIHRGAMEAALEVAEEQDDYYRCCPG